MVEPFHALLLFLITYIISKLKKVYEVVAIGVIHAMYVRLLSPCAERGNGTHPVVYPESNELQQGGAAGEGVPALRQHGLLRERDALVQGIRDEDGQRASL